MLNFLNAVNLGDMKNWAQWACNSNFTPRLESIKEAVLKADEMSQWVGGKEQQCRLCNVGSTKWQNGWAITYLLKAHFIGLSPAEIKWSEPRKCVCVCFVHAFSWRPSWLRINIQTPLINWCFLLCNRGKETSPLTFEYNFCWRKCLCWQSWLFLSPTSGHFHRLPAVWSVCLCIKGFNIT